MTRHLKIASILGLTGLLLAPASSGASSPLLSGYGGPGAGNQVILGSMLLNTPGGGSGSSGQGGAGGSGSSLSSVRSETASSSSRQASSTPQAFARKGRSAVSPSTSTGRAGTSQGSHGEALASSLSGAGGGGTLGLTGQDLLFICLTLAALACMAALTKRLARVPR